MYIIEFMKQDFCKKCGKCCKNIKADIKSKRLYFDGIQELDDNFLSMLDIIETKDGISLCKCKFLKDNLCTNSSKPEICTNYPSSPFAYLPPDCGYEGEIFMLNELAKQKIRKLKEEIVHYEILIKTTFVKTEQNQYKKIIDSHKRIIQKYSAYGSEDW